MIKNIVLDVGGVIFDDSKQNIQKLLNKNCDNIYKIAYGGGFKKCLLGEISVQEHINSLKNEKDFNDLFVSYCGFISCFCFLAFFLYY